MNHWTADHSLIVIDEYPDAAKVRMAELGAPFLRTAMKRVTQNLVNCSVRFVSRGVVDEDCALAPSKFSGQWTRYERMAAYYYEQLGFEVIRLEGRVTQFLEHAHSEHFISNERKVKMKRYLKKYMGKGGYKRFTHDVTRDDPFLRVVGSLGMQPWESGMAGSPPDFLVGNPKNTEQWFFAEVKGPSDRINLGQASWFVLHLPPDWDYEICAILNRPFTAHYLYRANGSRAGETYFDEYNEMARQGLEWRKTNIKQGNLNYYADRAFWMCYERSEEAVREGVARTRRLLERLQSEDFKPLTPEDISQAKFSCCRPAGR